MVTVGEFGTYLEATMAKASLESAGIGSIIPNENMIRLRGDMNPGLGLLQNGVSLQVAEADADQARLWLSQPTQDQPTQDEG